MSRRRRPAVHSVLPAARPHKPPTGPGPAAGGPGQPATGPYWQSSHGEAPFPVRTASVQESKHHLLYSYFSKASDAACFTKIGGLHQQMTEVFSFIYFMSCFFPSQKIRMASIRCVLALSRFPAHEVTNTLNLFLFKANRFIIFRLYIVM